MQGVQYANKYTGNLNGACSSCTILCIYRKDSEMTENLLTKILIFFNIFNII